MSWDSPFAVLIKLYDRRHGHVGGRRGGGSKPAWQISDAAELESKLREGITTRIVDTPRTSRNPNIVELHNGIMAVEKVHEDKSEMQQELFAYRLCQALGWEDLTPPIVKVSDVMTRQLYVPHSKNLLEVFPSLDEDKEKTFVTRVARQRPSAWHDFERIAILDLIMDNSDRHPGQILLTASGKVVAIDNASIQMGAFDSTAVKGVEGRPNPYGKEVKKALEMYGLTPAMRANIKRIANAKKFGKEMYA